MLACGVLIGALFTAMPEKTDFDSFDLTSPVRTTLVRLGPDEDDAVKAEVAALVAEVKAKTGVELAYAGGSSALAGEVFVSTQPWAAKNAWFVKLKNSILAIHGSDFEGTCRAVRAFRQKYVTPAKGPVIGGWTAIDLRDGPQREDVFDAELKRISEERKNNRDWENELVTERNRLPSRAYSFPLARAEDAFTADLPTTPFVKSLNGKWKYRWCGSPRQRVPEFFRADYDDSSWYSIDVPSCVEMKGFGRTGYVNIVYPHQNNPPFIGDDFNPVSSYRTRFTVPPDWKGRRVILRFDGVYSAYYVWVNGHKVGYVEDSCLPSEFDITDYLHFPDLSNVSNVSNPSNVSNLLCVEVYRWSDGSYLEDQDMFRLSGIFRDVSIWSKPAKGAIEDFFVQADMHGNLKVTCESGVDWTLYDDAYKKVAKKTGDAVCKVDRPYLWSAESPYLYTLVLATETDVRSCKVGFRSVELKPDGRICINGRSVKFRGTNRHDWSYENGHTLTHEELFKDVMLLKRYNFDSVRTSHYPNDPYFYHLCDRYGIYLQAEANLEAHGRFYGLDCLAHVPSWYKSHVERCTRMVQNYRNSPSIYMWSLGNEAGSGPAFEACHREMLKLDRSRLYMNRNDNENFRIHGHGYLTFEAMERLAKWTPYVMSEYAVAKGNALGNFEEYWEVFRRHDALPGGYVWDWYDQCVKVGTDRLDPNGRRICYWAYGGDFDEVPNDGNYATNGMIGPEREPSPELIEAGHVQRPLRVRLTNGTRMEISNYLAFTSADAYDGRWSFSDEGRKVAEGVFDVPAVEPGGKVTVSLPADVAALPGEGERFLRVSFHLKEETDWAPKGWEVAHDQMKIVRPDVREKAVKTAEGPAPRIVEQAGWFEIVAGPTHAVFSEETGTLSLLEMNGKPIIRDEQGICRGPRLTCRRGFTDDDIWLRPAFYASGLSQLRYHAHPAKVARMTDGSIVIDCTVDVDGAKSGGFVHETSWVFRGDGSAELKNVSTPKGKLPQLPRLGLSMTLDASLENVRYYGRGPWENYVDRCTGSDIGYYESTVTGQYVDYVRPQDNGYKTAVRWAAFVDETGDGVLMKGSEPMCLQALHFGVEELEFSRQRGKGGWKHSLDLEHVFSPMIPRKEVMVNFDLRQLGLGNAACGPRPLANYTPVNKQEVWTVTLVPVKGGAFREAARQVPQKIPSEPKDCGGGRSSRMGFDGA